MATQQPYDGDLATGDPTPASLRSGVVDQARRMATTQAMVFAAVELVWATTHFSLYPFGARSPRRGGPRHGYRIEHLNPVRRGMLVAGLVESGTPILLLHGFADNHSIFTVLRRGLLRRGFSRVFAMNYSVRTRDVRTAAAQLAEEVEAIVEEVEPKGEVLSAVAEACPDADLATTTSSLGLAEISEAAGIPGRLFGLHVFNPVPRMKLVEVCFLDGVGDQSRERALAWCAALGKTAV